MLSEVKPTSNDPQKDNRAYGRISPARGPPFPSVYSLARSWCLCSRASSKNIRRAKRSGLFVPSRRSLAITASSWESVHSPIARCVVAWKLAICCSAVECSPSCCFPSPSCAFPSPGILASPP